MDILHEYPFSIVSHFIFKSLSKAYNHNVINEISGVIDKIKESIKYIKASQTHCKIFDRAYLTPSKDEWRDATIIHNYLKIFYDATNAIFAIKNLVPNIFLMKFYKINMKTNLLCSTSNIHFSSMLNRMK
ncbi:hypothetical protein EJ110_NYTH07423 [Nymphaea thermarum]|nr:hypothetical protein EJ110_NYTH07423 [Nymphaea thermarum]